MTLLWSAEASGDENFFNVLAIDYGYLLPDIFLAPYRMLRHLNVIESDYLANGTIDSKVYFHYGADGRLARIEEDDNNDALIDMVQYITW